MLILDPSLLRDRLTYDPLEGTLRWRVAIAKHVRPGDDAGTLDDRGYIVVSIRNRKVYGHTVAWAMYHNQWPTGRITLEPVADRKESAPVRHPSRKLARGGSRPKAPDRGG